MTTIDPLSLDWFNCIFVYYVKKLFCIVFTLHVRRDIFKKLGLLYWDIQQLTLQYFCT